MLNPNGASSCAATHQADDSTQCGGSSLTARLLSANPFQYQPI